jgi:hypothetical protein
MKALLRLLRSLFAARPRVDKMDETRRERVLTRWM